MWKLFIAFIFVGTSMLHAQWIPVTARQKTTVSEYAAGKLISKTVSFQRIYRSSAGSVITQEVGQTPDGPPQSGQLIDWANTHSVLLVDYTKHRLMQIRTLGTAPDPRSFVGKYKRILKEDSVAGVRCLVQPIIAVRDNTREQIGTVCVAPDFDAFILREEVVEPTANGNRETLREVLSLQTGEPDPTVLQVDPSFSMDENTRRCIKP